MAELSLTRIAVAGALALAASMAPAQDAADQPLDETAFRNAAEGEVFDVRESGILRQREAFLGDGRVRLGFVPEGQSPDSRAPIPCVDGQWYMDGDAVCFTYVRPSGEPDGPHCWRIFDLGDGIQRAESAQPDSDLVLDLRRTDTPLICRGPEIGV